MKIVEIGYNLDYFQTNVIKHKNCQEESQVSNFIIESDHRPGKAAWKDSQKGIKCHNTPGDNDSGCCESNLPYCGEGSPEEWLVWKDKLIMA